MKYSQHDLLNIPAMHVPGFRTNLAIQDGVEKNILFRTWGGLGDQICAEPTLRYALKHFKDCRISLASEAPWLFSHLKFDRVYHIPHEHPDYAGHLLLDTITPPDDGNLVWQFMAHALVNCVDFSTLCALRGQLPIADREVKLEADLSRPQWEALKSVDLEHAVFVHAGKHWPSKTFPKEWWDALLNALIVLNVDPILIGYDSDPASAEIDPDSYGRGTVNVDPKGCIDLRNRLSAMESVWLLQRARVLLTNDSAPLHMAVTGDAWIGFIATCKHPDFITHWRKGQWGWRMKNHGNGGIWDLQSRCPNQNPEKSIPINRVDEETLRSWLPEPAKLAEWAVSKLEARVPEDEL